MVLSLEAVPKSSRRIRASVPPLLLGILALLTFHEGSSHEFTNWDDQEYIVENPLVHGLSPGRVWRAFTTFHLFNYNPLHLVSYMVDDVVWGLTPGGVFLTSLAIHAAAGVLLYMFAARWLGSRGGAFFVAAAFLVHPTRVESVAWLSERKDVLSGFFGVAAMLLYASFLEEADASAARWKLIGSWWLYLLALFSKSQLVTLPLVLLAMEAVKRRPWMDALRRQAPFLVLSAIFTYLTVHAHGGEASKGLGFPESLLNPLAALPRYLLHAIWPFDLSPYYDFPGDTFRGIVPVAAGAICLAASMLVAWRSLRGTRTWFFGLVWFFAFLAPVIGIVQIHIALADRYLYLALTGPVLALTATASRFLPPRVGSAAALGVVCLWSVAAMSYCCVFHDSESLWNRVLEMDPGSSMGHSNLAHVCLAQGRLDEAARHYDADLSERPYFETSFLGRAVVYRAQGDPDGARRMYELALEKRPQSALVRVEYANFLHREGKAEEALSVLSGLEAARATPLYFRKVAELFIELGRRGEALEAARRALELAPYDPELRRLREDLERPASRG